MRRFESCPRSQSVLASSVTGNTSVSETEDSWIVTKLASQVSVCSDVSESASRLALNEKIPGLSPGVRAKMSESSADVVQRRECDRAKVEAMGSSPIIRSKNMNGSLA